MEMVDAVAVGYVERFYGDCIYAAVIVAAYAALDEEVDDRFFTRIRAVRWTVTSINEHLNDIGLSSPMAKSEARGVLLDHCSSRGEITDGASSSKLVEVKKEPSVAGCDARKMAVAAGFEDDEVETMVKDAEKLQLGKNELIECSGFYARAMRAVGSEGLALDKAQAGEDPDNVTISGEGGVGLKVKTLGSKCIADTWKTVAEANTELAEMVARAQQDDKMHIVKRLNDIQNTSHLLTPAQKLPYLKKLFAKSYRGIPVAQDDLVMMKVEREWRIALESKSTSIAVSADSGKLKQENARLLAENARLQKLKGATGGQKSDMVCYLCQEKGHHIRDCPDQCKKCSTAKKHVLKSECECADEE